MFEITESKIPVFNFTSSIVNPFFFLNSLKLKLSKLGSLPLLLISIINDFKTSSDSDTSLILEAANTPAISKPASIKPVVTKPKTVVQKPKP